MTPALPIDVARALLFRHFGYSDFRPLQTRVVEAVLSGCDVLGVLPTGAGKSVCFQIPALLANGPTVVVSPLISLMQDQVAAARARGLPAGSLNSAVPGATQRILLDGAARGTVRLLYTSPERLPRLAVELDARGVRPALLAVDEAHCISEWGHDFRPSYLALRRLRERLGAPQALALTGSATPVVRAEITRILGLGRARGLATVVGSFDRRNLRFEVRSVADETGRLRALLQALGAGEDLAIVYAPTRNIVEELTRVLRETGRRAMPYHAGLSPDRRREVLSDFLAGRVRVMVATCAFGMGIDKPDVRRVVHWVMPPTPESYYQEAGRAGRDGGPARCILLYRKGDAVLPRRQLEVTFPPEALARRVWAGEVAAARIPANVRASLERLAKELRPERGPPDWGRVRRRRRAAEARIAAMNRYAAAGRCRRRALIGWFGERLPRCAGCDVCAGRTPLTGSGGPPTPPAPSGPPVAAD